MLDQNISTILAAVAGGVLAILGGFLATWVAQIMANRAEKRRKFHEKTEEIYILLNQVKIWAESIILSICELSDINPYTSVVETYDIKGSNFWFIGKSSEETPTCPIDRIGMLIDLYVPELQYPFVNYRMQVTNLQVLDFEQSYASIAEEKLKKHAGLLKECHIELTELISRLI